MSLVAITGLILLAAFMLLVLRVLYLICRGHRACAAQRAQMPDHRCIAPFEFVRTESNAVFCNEHGMYRLNERGEWVPFEDAA